jgi:hypothetical protein
LHHAFAICPFRDIGEQTDGLTAVRSDIFGGLIGDLRAWVRAFDIDAIVDANDLCPVHGKIASDCLQDPATGACHNCNLAF